MKKLLVFASLLAVPAFAQNIGRVDQGRANDGGPGMLWNVFCTNCTGGTGGGGGSAGGLTDAELRASPIPIGFDGGPVTVIGTVTVTGPLTDTQLRAVAVPVSGTVTANAGSGTMAVSGPLTDVQLRATPVPVSGTVTTGGLTDVQLRATAVPVSLTSTTVTGSVTTTNANLDVALSTRLAEATFTGRYPAAGALTDNFAGPTVTQIGAFNMLWDGANWDRAPGTSVDGALVNLGTNNDVTVTSGSITATQATGTNLHVVTDATSTTTVTQATGTNLHVVVDTLPALVAGSANIGDVDVLTLPALVAGTALIGKVGIDQTTPGTTNAVSAAQNGTWTVQPGNTPNTTPWLTTDTPRTVSSANNTGTCVSVTASTTVLASNASRRAYGFKASEDNTAKVHCKLGATATTGNVIFGPGASWSQDTGAVYTGVIDCVAASGTQSVCPYEFN